MVEILLEVTEDDKKAMQSLADKWDLSLTEALKYLVYERIDEDAWALRALEEHERGETISFEQALSELRARQ